MSIEERLNGLIKDTAGFVRSYTEGVGTSEVRRLFDREASEAWSTLKGDGVEVDGVLGRARILFLALSYRLTPARRVLFAGAIVAAALGLFDLNFEIGDGPVSIDSSPFWFLLSISGLIFVLALELVDRIRVRDEIELARELQLELLPAALPAVAGFSFAHSWQTANDLGGDYHDVIPLADGRLAVVMGDASGHGMAASLVMAIAHTTLRTAIDLDPSPAAVAELVNKAVHRIGGRRAFMTLFYGLLDPADGSFEFVTAGHPFPFLRRVDGLIEELGEGALPLGVHATTRASTGATTIAPGDLLLLYTDGLPEATVGPMTFGFDRIEQLLVAGGEVAEVHARVRLAFSGFMAGEPLEDDVSIVVMGRSDAD